MSKLIKTDKSYRDWIADVSKRFRQSQIKASMKVNDEMLRFYWALGRDIHEKSADAAYGSGFYQSVSMDLQEIFPDVHSFSVTNLKNMRYFYEMYPTVTNRRRFCRTVKSSTTCRRFGAGNHILHPVGTPEHHFA